MHVSMYVRMYVYTHVQIVQIREGANVHHADRHPPAHSRKHKLIPHPTVVLMTLRLGLVRANRFRSSIAVEKLNTGVRALIILV